MKNHKIVFVNLLKNGVNSNWHDNIFFEGRIERDCLLHHRKFETSIEELRSKDWLVSNYNGFRFVVERPQYHNHNRRSRYVSR